MLQDNSQNVTLVGACLETLLRFLNWIPLGYIFETKLISTLIYKVSHINPNIRQEFYTNTADYPITQ